MKEEDLIMARALVAEQAAAAAAAAAESSATLTMMGASLNQQQVSPGASPAPLRRTRVADLIEKRNQFR